MNIFIMRHGETFWNAKGLIQGSSDIALTPYGIELAEQTRDGFVREGIVFDRIYTSPYIRAVKTAEVVGEAQSCGILTDERIREMAFGDYEGKSLEGLIDQDENMKNCFTKPSAYIPTAGGESFLQVQTRAMDFFETELRPLEKKMDNVLVVCHGALIRTVLNTIHGWTLDEFWNNKQPNCSVNFISLINGTFQVEKENILFYEQKKICKRGIL